MKKKWTLHIVAVMVLVVFIVLGLASTIHSISQEEIAARASDGKGGEIILLFNDDDYTYYYSPPFLSNESPNSQGQLVNRPHSQYFRREDFTVYEDGEYVIQYSRESIATEKQENWSRKTVYVSNDQTVTVYIP